MVRYNQITGVYDFLESDEKQDPPTLSTVDAHHIGARLRTVLSCFVAGLLLGALAFHLSWAKGQTMDALRFAVIVMGLMFILRYMLPLRRINWMAIIGAALGVVLVIVCPNLSLSSLGTEQLLLVLGIFLLMR